jgi:hypothetical protein
MFTLFLCMVLNVVDNHASILLYKKHKKIHAKSERKVVVTQRPSLARTGKNSPTTLFYREHLYTPTQEL